MAKSSDGYFWIGGPGEEAFNVALGLIVNKGEGLRHDYLHFHYRNLATMIAMGEPVINPLRQMASKVTDPYTGGRNFVNHFAKKEWNVAPVTSTIETQYVVALGTARAQSKAQDNGISIVTGGDAGSAQGDFASCLGWSNIPGKALPLLIIITNNQYGISTPYQEVHGDASIAKRAEAFGIKWAAVDGNNFDQSYQMLNKASQYVRKMRKPVCIEARVSRLYGHSSSSGANRVENEIDCIDNYIDQLLSEKVIDRDKVTEIRKEIEAEIFEALKKVREEAFPDSATIFRNTFAEDT